MADPLEHALLVAEIAQLKKQQSEANINAIYLGWTREEEAARNKRNARLVLLHRQLTGLDGTSRSA
jgi:hypothetical protein